MTEGRETKDRGSLPDMRCLHVFLKLRDDAEDTDAAIVESLKGARWFTHVFLVTPSWRERPDAANHYLVRRAINVIREQGITVVWGRWLWVAWPGSLLGASVSFDEAEYSAAYYAAALTRIKMEARFLGADGTYMDAEPYGNSPQKRLLTAVIDGDERTRIDGAIAEAVKQVDPVDFIRPSSSSRSTHYAWSMCRLGNLRLESKSYEHSDVAEPLKVDPPPNKIHYPGLWGVHVTPENAAKFRDIDFAAIKRNYPSCKGVWAWIKYHHMVRVLHPWSQFVADVTDEVSRETAP